MIELTRLEMKKVMGGYNTVSTCSIKCSDQVFHNVDCGNNACETTTTNKVNCTDGLKIVSTTDPCKDVVAPF